MPAAPDSLHVFITGASRGLGSAIARAFAAPGALIGVHYARNEAAARETARAVKDAGAKPYRVRAAFTETDAVDRVYDAIAAHGRTLDALVLNAGIAAGALLVNTSEETWDAALDVNYRAHARLARRCAAGLMRTGGHIIVVSSLAGLRGAKGLAAYAASKGALCGFVRDAAIEFGARGICINALLPGWLRTEMTAGLDEREFAAHIAGNALGRGTTVEEAAAFARHLATMRNVSGQVFNLDSRSL